MGITWWGEAAERPRRSNEETGRAVALSYATPNCAPSRALDVATPHHLGSFQQCGFDDHPAPSFHTDLHPGDGSGSARGSTSRTKERRYV
jgi:hypothetical protein